MDAAAGDQGGLAALQETLAALKLNAKSPTLVCRKALEVSDVNVHLSHLSISQPRGGGGRRGALAAYLTERETDLMASGGGHGCGAMHVPVFDRHGNRYDMVLRHLEAIGLYRLCGGGWRRFLTECQLAGAMAAAKKKGRELGLELWAFRSTDLLPEGAGGDDHHAEGALGFAISISENKLRRK